jgi:uncharacterized protein
VSLKIVLNRDSAEIHPIDPRLLGCHTAVLAQSGSGKSFLVGRIIEELLLGTKARVVVLDPNSDFVRLPAVDEDAWINPQIKKWHYPDDTRGAFASMWADTKHFILTNRNLPTSESLRINWGGLTDRERSDVMDIDAAAEPELYWSLVLAGEIARNRWDSGKSSSTEPDYDFEYFRKIANEVCDFLLGGDGQPDIASSPLSATLRSARSNVPLRFRTLIESLEQFEIWRANGAGELDIADVLRIPPTHPTAVVIDLLSVNTEAERLALASRSLAAIWEGARDAYSQSLLSNPNDVDQRVPTFVVIDEAHNLAPLQRKSPAAERLAADIIRIAAEGRKFGLFLLVVTQRPRKLDPNVLSECDALFLMKMTNSSDVAAAIELFGFLQPGVGQQAKYLKVGEVFLQGRLGGTETVWHVAPRRTRQGGKSLDDTYWSSPYPSKNVRKRPKRPKKSPKRFGGR